jgi:hypothetical protein
MNCGLCGSKDISRCFNRNNADYFMCAVCGLVFIDHKKHPSVNELRQRYQKHENTPGDQGYRDFLMELASPCFKFIDNKCECLDYGCGPTKIMEVVFENSGYKMESYDPFFYPEIPLKKYDMVTCNEVVEHFFFPIEEFLRIKDIMKSGGYLGIGTYLWDERTDLKTWHYLTDITHTSIYSSRSIGYLARLLGLEVIESDARRVTILRKPK